MKTQDYERERAHFQNTGGERLRGEYAQGPGFNPGEIRGSEWWTEGPYRGRAPKGYRRYGEHIWAEVADRLTQHGRIDASDIEISERALLH